MTANPDRGEREITLDGKAYPLRPSYGSMRAIEARIGNLIKLYRRMAEDNDGLSCDELALIVTECIKAAGEDRNDAMLKGVQQKRIAELIYEAGLVGVFEQILPLVADMLSGGTKKKPASTETPQSE